MSIQILDCTLRDGGYINDWHFGRRTIASILDKLDRARIDIIECGFLTGMVQDRERSLFGSVAEIAEVLPARARQAMFVAMIAIGEKELHPDVLAVLDQLQKFGFCHRSNSPLSMWFYTFLLYGIFHALSNPFCVGI